MHFLQFGLYFFLFLLTESVVNEKAVVVGEIGWVNYVYGIGLLFTALGYHLYAVIKKRTDRTFTIVAGGISALAVLGIAMINSFVLAVCFSYLGLLTFGYIGGYVHDDLSRRLGEKNSSLKIGAVTALAILFQFIVQNALKIDLILTVIIIALLTIVLCILNNSITKTEAKPSREAEESMPIETLNVRYSNRSLGKRIMVYAIVVALMSCILAFQDSIVVERNAAGEIHLFSFVRLFYAVGLLCAGVISNIKNSVYLPLSASCAMILSVLAIYFMDGSEASYNFGMTVMYFYCGFYVMFFTVAYMELGVLKNDTALYSGMGRVVRSITTAAIVILTTMLDGIVNPDMYVIISTLMCIGIILIMALSGELVPESSAEVLTETIDKDNSTENELIDFCSKYELTNKEQEAFEMLMTTEMGVQEIADEMMISRRVLQRHISSIYSKTGTKTRVGLMILLKNSK